MGNHGGEGGSSYGGFAGYENYGGYAGAADFGGNWGAAEGANAGGFPNAGETAHVVDVPSHRPCSPKDMLLRLVNQNSRLVDLTTHPDVQFRNSYQQVQELRGLNPWSEYKGVMPSGHYPGARGSTEFWVEYWQVADEVPWWMFWSQVGPKALYRSYIQIGGATWTYSDAGHLQTRLVFDVKSFQKTVNGYWDRNQVSFEDNCAAAKSLAEEMTALLTQ